MRRVAWLAVAVMLAVIGGKLYERREDPETRRFREAIADLPLTDAERDVVVDAYRNRDLQPPSPRDVTDRVLDGADRYRMSPDGRLRLRISFGDGAWYLYDRQRLANWQDGEPWQRAIADASARHDGFGMADGIVLAGWCGEADDAPLDIAIRRRAPRVPSGADAVTDFDFDVPTGDAVIEGNGDGSAQALVAMPAGRYRARLSLTGSTDCLVQRYALDLWPRRAAGDVRMVRRPRY